MERDKPARLRILVVDDQAADRITLHAVLALEIPEAEIAPVGNAEELLEAVSHPVDGAVVDPAIEWGDGVKIAAALHRRFPAAPILFFADTPIPLSENPELALILRGQIAKSRQGFVEVARRLRTLLERTRRIEPARTQAKRDLLSELPYPALVVGEYGNVLRWNESARRSLGAAEDPGRRPTIDTLLTPPKPAKGWRSYLATLDGPVRFETEARQTGESVAVEIWPVETPGGETRVFGLRIGPEAAQALSGALAPGADLAEEFIQVVSHDLREPLHALRHYVERLAHAAQGLEPEKMERNLEHLRAHSAQLQSIVDGLSEYAGTASDSEIHEWADLDTIVNEALVELAPQVDEAGAQIVCDSLPKVRANAEQMRVLFRNLISNALKFRSQEPPQIRITVSEKKSSWIFGISDNGIGIAEEEKDKVFQMFHRGAAAKGKPGRGIGLAICARIVARHGGRIWVRPGEDRGTTLLFTLPKRGDETPTEQ